MNEDISFSARNFLDIQIQKKIESKTCNSQKVSQSKVKISTSCLPRKRLEAAVTKTQQKVKTSYKNSQSEEAAIKKLNLADALKNRNKKIKISSNVESLPTIPDKSGDNRQFWSGTYVNVKNLYGIAISKGALLTDDKDKYLVNKFLDKNSKWFASGIDDILIGKTLFGSFIIDRLISAIFCKISK